MEDRAPMPRAAATLGMELIDADVEIGTIDAGAANGGLSAATRASR
jgi:hypothetical protein